MLLLLLVLFASAAAEAAEAAEAEAVPLVEAEAKAGFEPRASARLLYAAIALIVVSTVAR